MNVLIADHLGMCFGVRDAIAAARSTRDPHSVTLYGEIVHNPEVVAEMDRRGFSRVPEGGRDSMPTTPSVLITAHGVSQRERNRLVASGKTLIDTTCPLVHRAHEAARSLDAAGYFVVVIGKRDHVEVRGLVGDLGRYAVVETVEQATTYDSPRIGVVCQTTTAPREASEIFHAICEQNPGKEVRLENTICRPTLERQQAVADLLSRVELLVVVGGRSSNNTRKLADLAEERGVPSHHVESAEELDPRWFEGVETVGLTAGTSTPDDVVRQVWAALETMGTASSVAPATRGTPAAPAPLHSTPRPRSGSA